MGLRLPHRDPGDRGRGHRDPLEPVDLEAQCVREHELDDVAVGDEDERL